MTAPGGFVAGDILGAADLNGLPAGIMGYAQATTSQASITALTDLTSLTVTFTAVAGRRYKVTGQVILNRTATAPNPGTLYLREGTTVLAGATRDVSRSGSTPAGWETLQVFYVNSSSISGSKTWKLSLIAGDFSANTADTLTMYASSTEPAFILVEDIGPI